MAKAQAKSETSSSMTENPDAFAAERHRMIEEAAYYIAEKRGFDGEHELEDWLQAEQMINQTIQ